MVFSTIDISRVIIALKELTIGSLDPKTSTKRSVESVLTNTLMPCPFTGPKMFGAGPNILCQTKNLFTYCGSHKHFVPDKKMICIQ